MMNTINTCEGFTHTDEVQAAGAIQNVANINTHATTGCITMDYWEKHMALVTTSESGDKLFLAKQKNNQTRVTRLVYFVKEADGQCSSLQEISLGKIDQKDWMFLIFVGAGFDCESISSLSCYLHTPEKFAALPILENDDTISPNDALRCVWDFCQDPGNEIPVRNGYHHISAAKFRECADGMDTSPLDIKKLLKSCGLLHTSQKRKYDFKVSNQEGYVIAVKVRDLQEEVGCQQRATLEGSAEIE